MLDLFKSLCDDRGEKFDEAAIFNEIIAGALFHHLDGETFVPLTGHDDKWEREVALSELVNEIFAGHIGELQIQKKEVGVMVGEPRESCLTAMRERGVKPFSRKAPLE